MLSFLQRFALLLVMPLLLIGLAACSTSNDSTDTATDTNAVSNAGGETNTAASLTGNWNGTFGTGAALAMSLTQNGDIVTGTYATEGNITGTVTGSIAGDTLNLTVVASNGSTAEFTGVANAARTSMTGTFEIIAGGGGSGTWSATK